ncbi:transcription initiation factor TFIID subunit 12 [Harpegnathos saltator]|uniref:Transcription initiation factor TFIID subunit 12 n=1 Tax=Harpegnathos saltator TaxID=610380 RepID=E2BPI9_HARSA|nr:transcription initiation factor TFIID subunit 12 [Harpegnathos saltator]EFN82393.1 Transcription initiation factor TFIID subunit 12 [Harpegnathos saltator]
MAQQSAIVQTSNAGTDIVSVLGTLQSVGPNSQSSPALPNMQNNVTTTTTVQPQTQSQQTQYVSQPPKQVQVQQQQPQTQPQPPPAPQSQPQSQQPPPPPPPQQQQQQQQSSTPSSFNDFPQFLTKTRLEDLVKEVDPTEQLDEEVEEMLLQLADDFVETTVNAACLLAKHRHANTVEVKDVQLHLERNWNMWIPGFGTDEVRPYKRATVTEAHKQRLALIRKSIKKY